MKYLKGGKYRKYRKRNYNIQCKESKRKYKISKMWNRHEVYLQEVKNRKEARKRLKRRQHREHSKLQGHRKRGKRVKYRNNLKMQTMWKIREIYKDAGNI